MSNAGIDYGMGRTNIDLATGIRYGVISCGSLMQEALYGAQELDYGDAHCPKCGNPAVTIPTHSVQHENGVYCVQEIPEAYEMYEVARGACGDYACETCAYLFDGDEAFPDEALGWHIADGEYQVSDCLDSDAIVINAPYFTYGRFCSPCVPGAVSLDSPIDDGAKAFCFGHDWFDGAAAPYPVYSVETGELVPAPEKGE